MPIDKTPRVFVSYSWDTEQHKNWVLAFVKRLREKGIDAFIDQTDLQLGARAPEFMERAVRDSDRVVVICTDTFKHRFDNRKGGAGYEGHIITGEIVSEVGPNKFIPVLKQGDWKTAMPTALTGIYGVDLRTDSNDEFRKLVDGLHGVSRVPPIGARSARLNGGSGHFPEAGSPSLDAESDLSQYWEQRKKVPDTDLIKAIWSKPRWRIWIRPMRFRRARFQNLNHCRSFMLSSSVGIQSWFAYPGIPSQGLEIGDEWIAGEVHHHEPHRLTRMERWALFRSGQFVHNRSLEEIPQLGERVHVLEILDTATAVFEFAARMAKQGVLSAEASITLELQRVDGRELTWPQNVFGDRAPVPPNCWCQEDGVNVVRQISDNDLVVRRRDLGLEAALEILTKFSWSEPPKQPLIDAQNRRFGVIA
jgi:TIR domain